MWHDYVGEGVDLQTYKKYASKQLLMLALHIVIVFFMIIIYFYFQTNTNIQMAFLSIFIN